MMNIQVTIAMMMKILENPVIVRSFKVFRTKTIIVKMNQMMPVSILVEFDL
jgi:hypothetical protein